MDQIASIYLLTEFLEADISTYVSEALPAQSESVATNHSSLATATTATYRASNRLSMISCHAYSSKMVKPNFSANH